MAGMQTPGSSGLLETGVKGLALMMAETSAMKVVKHLWMSLVVPTCKEMESRILRAMPIILSQAPPI